MEDTAPTHERRKLVKTYQNVLPRKWIAVAEVYRGDLLQNDKNVE